MGWAGRGVLLPFLFSFGGDLVGFEGFFFVDEVEHLVEVVFEGVEGGGVCFVVAVFYGVFGGAGALRAPVSRR
jgi:hypothetical protein